MASHGKTHPRRGEVWVVDFSPSIGSEMRDRHPALVVSVDELNASPWGLIVVCPISTFRKEKPFRLHILLSPPEGGVKHPSIIRCDQVKSVSIQRFSEKWGEMKNSSMDSVDFVLKRILGL